MAASLVDEGTIKILTLIRQGHNVMVELMDFTGLGGEVVNHDIEFLDQNRYIERAGFLGGKFWVFSLTAKGLDALPEMDDGQKAFYELGLWPSDLKTLHFFENSPGVIASEQIHTKIADTQEQRRIAASLVKLLRLGYIREFGFNRRKVAVNASGRALLEKYRGLL